jgi:hypothetical protein
LSPDSYDQSEKKLNLDINNDRYSPFPAIKLLEKNDISASLFSGQVEELYLVESEAYMTVEYPIIGTTTKEIPTYTDITYEQIHIIRMVFFGTLTVFTWVAFIVFAVRLALTRKNQVSRQEGVIGGNESDSNS